MEDALTDVMPGDRVRRGREPVEDRRREAVRQGDPRNRQHDDRAGQGHLPVQQRDQRRRIQGKKSQKVA